jgi:KDO2-lipid IV(A) lauroyltransferase
MYWFLYCLLYLLSLLPFSVLYGISDFAVFILYYVAGYRKEVVMENLYRAFPEKSEAERKKIAHQFYRNLVDNFLETFKMLSMSKASMKKRALFDLAEVKEMISKGKNIVFLSGHQMNWEWGPWALASGINIPLLGPYMRIASDAVNRLFLKIRGRTGVILIDATKFSTIITRVSKEQHAIGLIADQSPSTEQKTNWMYFFGEATPFAVGPEKRAKQTKAAVFFVDFIKKRRGHYLYKAELITEDGSLNDKGEIMRAYRDLLEASVRKQPSNYLWSHKRWKRKYDSSQLENWIDNRPVPSN